MTHLVACPKSNAVMVDRVITLSGQFGLTFTNCNKICMDKENKWFAIIVGDNDGWTTKFIDELNKSNFLNFVLLTEVYAYSEEFRKNQEVGIIVGDSHGHLYSVFNDVTEISNLCCFGYSWPVTNRIFNGNMDLNAARSKFSRFLNLFNNEEEHCFDIIRFREEPLDENFPTIRTPSGVWYVETVR